MKLIMKLNKKTKIVLALLIVMIPLTIFLTYRQYSKNTSITIPLQTPVPIPASDGKVEVEGLKPKTVEINKSNLEDLTKALGDPITQKENMYEFKSKSTARNHTALIENNSLILFKEVITYDQEKSLSGIIEEYNLKNPVILYGDEAVNNVFLYVYPEAGIAYQSKEGFDYLVDLWYFEPTDINTFKIKFGEGFFDNLEQAYENDSHVY